MDRESSHSDSPMNILLSGGTGFIGIPLARKLLEAGHSLIFLCRDPKRAQLPPSAAVTRLPWNQLESRAFLNSMSHKPLDAIINLAGENIARKRWTSRQKAVIRSSRLHTLQRLIYLTQQLRSKPNLFIQSSAIGYYGNVPEGDVLESHSAGSDFLAQVCADIERETEILQNDGIRTVCLRTGLVLAGDGGALSRMLLPFRFFAGGHPGSGRQWMSWIHRNDLLNIFLFLLSHSSLQGPVNATAPQAERMKQFCRMLGHALHRPSWAPVPAFALKLIIGPMADMILSGQKVIPDKLLKEGFAFKYPELSTALEDIVNAPMKNSDET